MQEKIYRETVKVFVGGLLPETEQGPLFRFFNKRVQIKSLELKKRSNNTAVCVGHAVIQCSPNAFKLLTEQGFFNFEGRAIHCIPFMKGERLQEHLKGLNSRRIAIWGILRTTPDSVIYNYFRQFGAIQSAFVLHIPSLEKPDAFVVFES